MFLTLSTHSDKFSPSRRVLHTFFYKKLKDIYVKKKIYLCEHDEKFLNKLKEKIIPGNNIIFLGAGLSSKVANQFKNYLKKC